VAFVIEKKSINKKEKKKEKDAKYRNFSGKK